MDNVQKLFSDIEKLKKHERAANGNLYDGEKICIKIKDLFARNNTNCSSLALSYADYWFDAYIAPAADKNSMPDKKALDVLGAMQFLLENDPDSATALSDADWKELCSLTNLEADELDLNLLNDLMVVFVDHQAF